MWHSFEDEGLKEVEQKIVLRDPNGRERIGQAYQFTTEKQWHRITARVGAVPVHPSGNWKLELYIRENGPEGIEP